MATDDDDLTARYRVRLERELADLESVSRETAEDRAPVELDQQGVGRLSRMDAMQRQAMSEAADKRRRIRIARIRRALSQLDDGEYGYCLDCGNRIPDARLEVDLVALRCVSCAKLLAR